MENHSPSDKGSNRASSSLDGQMQRMSLGPNGAEETPESQRFHSLPQAMQRRLLLDYPRILATALHRYSEGADCEEILLQVFEGASEMLRVRDNEGDSAVASALLRAQGERAAKLLDIAEAQNSQVLEDRSRSGESLLMLSTSSGTSAEALMERLLIRDPTQLHRLYDKDGRNFLHHCALEESAEILEAGLRITKKLLEGGRLEAGQVSAAIHMTDMAGDTVLHMMAARDRPDMLSLLVQFGEDTRISIDLDERQHRGNRLTPLMSAIRAGAVRAARFLLDNGADPLAEDSEGTTAESMAASTSEINDVNMKDNEIVKVESEEITSPKAEADPASASDFWFKVPDDAKFNPDCSVDSGVESTCSKQEALPDASLDEVMSEWDMTQLEDQLMRNGNARQFISALFRLKGQRYDDWLLQMSERPVRVAFGILAAHGWNATRRLVFEALHEANEVA